MYKHILVATGGAEHSQRAEKRAVELAKSNEAKLSLITVRHTKHETSYTPEDTQKRIQESILQAAATRCEELGILPETYLRMGNAGKSIIEVAKEIDCDLIVVGNRQLSLIGVMAEGSISDYVVRHTNTDVLTVI